VAEALKAAAREYWLEGCNIVLLKGKEPLHKWSRWQHERQNELDFEALPWQEADGFAIICGQQLNNGLYVGPIDFDVKNLPSEVVEKGRQVLRFLPTTQRDQTSSGGEHWIYVCHVKPKTVSVYHNVCGLEILGEGKLCIMAPSKGYRRLNDNTPTEVEDLETLFYQALEKAGIKVEKPSQAWFDQPDLSKQPYRGKDPPCIKALLKGAKEGFRNEYGIRLASYFINFKQYKPETVRKEILKNWNKLNTPELHWKELDVIVKSAVEHGYVYGCSDEFLAKFCDEAKCPLWVKPKEEFPEESKEKARQLLKDPAFFYKLGKVFEMGFVVPKIDKPRFVIGEERNKRLLGFLLTGAAKHQMTSIIKVLGEPGTAKDTMLRMWLKLLEHCLKVAERSFFTAATLRYSEELQGCDLLYIPDSPELTGEKGRHLRFMRADDGGLISEYALKDPDTGEMTTKTVTLPVKAVATTSNAVTGDIALESGMWTLHTNASPELTKKVKLEKLKFRAGKRQLFPEEELKVWQCAFWLLLNEEPMQELPKVPYAENLEKLLESERSESRRDPDKLCDLISLIAWVRRFQKSKEKWQEADLVDLYIALQLGLDAITETISDLDVKEQQIFAAVKKGVIEDVTARFVADETGIPYKTCYRLMEKLVEKGFLNKDKKGGRNIYSVFSGKEPKNLLIGERSSQIKPEQLMEFVLSLVGDFSPSHNPTEGGYPLEIIDPITGEKVVLESMDNDTKSEGES
jgi:predicted transcriptional regulator